jgi:hypothetical protein
MEATGRSASTAVFDVGTGIKKPALKSSRRLLELVERVLDAHPTQRNRRVAFGLL